MKLGKTQRKKYLTNSFRKTTLNGNIKLFIVVMMIPKIKPETKFGKLTVVSWNSQRKEYLCKCECGNETYARSWALKSGRHKACKCGLREARISARIPNDEGIKRDIFRAYKSSAKKKGKRFSLTYKQFLHLISQNCHYCGIGPSQKWKTTTTRSFNSNFVYNGIDRKNNDAGYEIENCVPCCELCNNSKKNFSYEKWMEWLNRICLYQKMI